MFNTKVEVSNLFSFSLETKLKPFKKISSSQLTLKNLPDSWSRGVLFARLGFFSKKHNQKIPSRFSFMGVERKKD